MQAEDFIASLFADAEKRASETVIHDYDPVKRREYYLKNRELKGRKPRLTDDSVGHLVRGKVVVAKKPKKPKQTPAQKRKAVAANLEALKGRLERLREVLRELVKAAKGRSGAKDEDKHKKREPSKQTAKQKADAKKRSKEYYDKHKGTPEAQVKEIQAKIKEIQAKIADLRAKLASSNKKPVKKDELRSAVSSTTKK